MILEDRPPQQELLVVIAADGEAYVTTDAAGAGKDCLADAPASTILLALIRVSLSAEKVEEVIGDAIDDLVFFWIAGQADGAEILKHEERARFVSGRLIPQAVVGCYYMRPKCPEPAAGAVCRQGACRVRQEDSHVAGFRDPSAFFFRASSVFWMPSRISASATFPTASVEKYSPEIGLWIGSVGMLKIKLPFCAHSPLCAFPR